MEKAGFSTAEDGDALLDSLLSDLDRLIFGEFWKMTGDQLLALGRRMETLGRKVWAAQVHLVDELPRQGAATARSTPSTAALVRQAFAVSPGEAGNRVRAARELLAQDLPSGGETPARLPVLADAVHAGAVAADHVRTVVTTMHRLPDTLPAQIRSDAETTLVEHVASNDPEQFRKIARHLEAVLDPDGTLPDPRIPAARWT